MRRHIIALVTLAIAASSTFLSLAATHANPDFDFTIADPTGDTIGVGPVQHDIVSVSGVSDGANLILTIEFAGAIDTPNSGAPNKVIGFIAFDTDSNPATGQDIDSEIAQFCPNVLGLGAEVLLSIFATGDDTAPLYDLDTLSPVVDVPLTFDTTSFSATIPISALGDEYFRFAAVFGGNDPKSDEEVTDCAPGGGGFIDTADYLPPLPPTPTVTTTAQPPTATQAPPTPTVTTTAQPPTATQALPTPTVTTTAQPPTATQALSTPTSTVAAVTLPAAGLDSRSHAGWLPWLLLGAGVIGSLAGVAALSRRRVTVRRAR